jgi:hypothetical protein
VTSNPAALVAARYARATAAAAVLVATLWHLVYDIPAVMANWSGYGSTAAAWASAAVWVVYFLVGSTAGVLVLRGRSVPWFERLGLAVLLAGVPVVVAAAAPTLTFTAANWVWGTFGWYAILLLWRRPLAGLLAALAANGALVLVTMALSQPLGPFEVSQWGMVVFGTVSLQLLLAVGARLLERDAALSAEATAAQEAVAHRRLAAQAVHAARQRRYRSLGRSAGDLLAGLASGELDPGTAPVQRAAAVEAARLRRLLAEHDDVPDPLLHELRASADVAERRGVLVDLRSVGTMAPVSAEVRRSLAEPVLQVLVAARTRARVTVAGDGAAVSVAVVADVPPDAEPSVTARVGHTDVVRHREEETLWLEATWRGP